MENDKISILIHEIFFSLLLISSILGIFQFVINDRSFTCSLKFFTCSRGWASLRMKRWGMVWCCLLCYGVVCCVMESCPGVPVSCF